MKVALYRHSTHGMPASRPGLIYTTPTLEELVTRPVYQQRTWGPYTPIPLAEAHEAVVRAVGEAMAEVDAGGGSLFSPAPGNVGGSPS